MKAKIKLMVVDDQKIFVESLSKLLNLFDSLEVIDTAENGQIALDKIKSNQPDVVILDYEMPVMNGEQTAIQILDRFPKIKIIILSMYDETVLTKHLFDIGIHCYLPKNCDSQQLINAVNIVLKEDRYIPEELAERLDEPTCEKRDLNKKLTKIEIDIIRFMCFGKEDKDILPLLGITIGALKNHKKNIRDKTGIKTAAQFGAYGVKHGIVKPEDLRIR